MAAATPGQLSVVGRVGDPDLSDDDVAAIQQAIVDTGALDDLEATIARRTEEALAALDELDLDGGADRELAALAEFVVHRDV